MKKLFPGIIISLLFFIVQLLTLSDYGMHEDSPFHFLRGQAYLQKILTGKAFFNFPQHSSPVYFAPSQKITLYKPNASEEVLSPRRPFGDPEEAFPTLQAQFNDLITKFGRESFYKHNAWSTNNWDLPSAKGHPAVSDIFMAATNRLFYEKLGWLGDVEAYHLYIVIAASISIFFLYLFTLHAFGVMAAVFAALSLALFPFFFAESHFNIKDPTQMSFFTVSLISFYFFVTSKFSLKWYVSFIIFTYLALGTKWNIAFLPLIILPWLFLVRKKETIKPFLNLQRLILYGLGAVIIPFILLLISWPYLWSDPLPRLTDTFSFYSVLAFKDMRVDLPSSFPLPLGFDAEGILRVLFMTPPVLLLLFIFGIAVIILEKSKNDYKQTFLVLLWFILPVLRVSRQDTQIIGSIRNYMEYLPAFAVIAGLGASFIISKLSRLIKFDKNYIAGSFLVIFLISLTPAIYGFHPNENIYFNFLIGGPQGAVSHNLYEWETPYDNPYRQAVNWFNKNAPPKAKLAIIDGTMLSMSPLWLRPDIYTGSFFSGFDQKGEYIISVVYPKSPAVYTYNYLNDFLNPVYELKIDNLTVLKIWQNSPQHVKPGFQNRLKLEGNFPIVRKVVENRKIWEIDLGKSYKITNLLVSVTPGCSFRTSGVWRILNEGKGDYIKPFEIPHGNNQLELDFPGTSGDVIRFWDVEGNSCIYDAAVESIYALK